MTTPNFYDLFSLRPLSETPCEFHLRPPAGFPKDLVCWKLPGQLTNGNHMSVGCHKCELIAKHPNRNHLATGTL